MNYLVYHFRLTPADPVAIELLPAVLADVGFDSFEQTDEGVEAYVDADAAPCEAVLRDALEHFPLRAADLGIAYTVSPLADQNWNEQWEREHFEPIVLDGLCVIHDTRHAVAPQPYDLVINPRMAFGSGTHATTSMLVRRLLTADLSRLDCLDMGCGTGILAICMARRGAASVTAIDIDPHSAANARDNCALNAVPQVRVLEGDAAAIDADFDLIVANIHRNIIIADLPVYAAHLRPRGALLLSGFFGADVPAIEAAARPLALRLADTESTDDWTVCRFEK